jgi:hypothetical protein
VAAVAEKAISVRLDFEAQEALEWIMRHGLSRSEAIREALVGFARLREREQMRADAERIGRDAADRAEIADVRALMEELAPPG